MLGLRLRWLGSERLTWGDLRAIVMHSGPKSALRRALGNDWEVSDYLLATVVDLLALANWQRQGKKGAPKPRPVPRPGSDKSVKYGADPIPVSEFSEWWEEVGNG